MTSWEEIGRQLQGYYAPQWHRQNENSQCWCQTLSNSCRLKSPLWPKGEHRDGIFCGIRSSSCQRYPLGPPPLQTNWSGLCRVQLRAKNKKRDHCSVLAFACELQTWGHHMQTWDSNATLLRTPLCYVGQHLKSLSLQASLHHFGPPHTSIQAITKNHTLYLTSSASMKLGLTCHIKCKHKYCVISLWYVTNHAYIKLFY